MLWLLRSERPVLDQNVFLEALRSGDLEMVSFLHDYQIFPRDQACVQAAIDACKVCGPAILRWLLANREDPITTAMIPYAISPAGLDACRLLYKKNSEYNVELVADRCLNHRFNVIDGPKSRELMLWLGKHMKLDFLDQVCTNLAIPYDCDAGSHPQNVGGLVLFDSLPGPKHVVSYIAKLKQKALRLVNENTQSNE